MNIILIVFSLSASHHVIQIQWEYRKDRSRTRCHVYVTIDGTDFRIKEPSPFDPGWYSHKFKGPGVRYEVGVCIATGWIVWLNGPYMAGRWPDIKIANDLLHIALDHGERYIADKGYMSPLALAPRVAITNEEERYMSICRTRHETVNSRFKIFAIIGNTFVRDVTKHGMYTHAIANIVQVGIMHGKMNPFSVYRHVQEPRTWPSNWWY